MNRTNKRNAAKRSRKPRHAARAQTSARISVSQLQGLFGSQWETVLRRACEGESAEQIATELNLSVHKVQQFIDHFVRLPRAMSDMLLRSPELLGNDEQMKSLIRSGLRSARKSRRRPR